ncbi:NADP-dependent oxidoreductase [Halalkalibaculum sp. DA3122]|uniref:NADP-dependent oxidoreductase n=1 Tax=Halalkalibaculum sp. DA3122 TaxID=3373607 RepID=UPI00375433EB
MAEKMKAAVFHKFGNLENVTVEEVDIPEAGEGEVLVRVEAAGVNPVDAKIVQGYLKNALPHEFPVVSGWDFAGVVEERGFSARRFEPGDKVYGYARRPVVQWGTFAEHLVIPESYLAHRPGNIPVEQAAGIPLVGLTAYQSLYDAGDIQEEEKVLILGASGGVGSMGIQLAKEQSAHVIGVASEKNHAYMKKLGADEAVDYRGSDIGKAVQEIHKEGVDLIFDCAGGETLQQSLKALKPGGRLVSIRDRGADLDSNIRHKYVFVEPNSSELQHLRELVESGRIGLPVSGVFELAEVVEALEKVVTLHTKGKMVIKM